MSNYDVVDREPPRIGSTHDQIRNIKHLTPMYSLRKVSSVSDWVTKTAADSYWVEPKIDGCAIALHYDDGKLIQAITRGDGKRGCDVTDNFKLMQPKLASVHSVERFEVRGEFYIKADKPNPAARASGLLQHHDKEHVADSAKTTRFAGYDIQGLNPMRYLFQRDFMSCNGISPVPFGKMLEKPTDQYVQKRFHENYSDIPTDGIVVKVDCHESRAELGYTARAPRWAVAVKPKDTAHATELIAVISNVSSTGAVVPVAYFKPVKISGKKVNKATLHNWNYVADLGLHYGDTLAVTLSKGVIPKIVDVLIDDRPADAERIEAPVVCPACAHPIQDNKCHNRKCVAKLEAAVCRYVGKKAADVYGVGPKLVHILVSANVVSSPDDIYFLTDLSLRSCGIQNRDKLLSAIESSTQVELSRFIFGLNIQGVGSSKAEFFAKEIEAGRLPAKLQEWLADASNARVLSGFALAGVVAAERIEDLRERLRRYLR